MKSIFGALVLLMSVSSHAASVELRVCRTGQNNSIIVIDEAKRTFETFVGTYRPQVSGTIVSKAYISEDSVAAILKKNDLLRNGSLFQAYSEDRILASEGLRYVIKTDKGNLAYIVAGSQKDRNTTVLVSDDGVKVQVVGTHEECFGD